uniref:zonadhesin-like isoform X2 n=1 Tax=Ciona intestinalis TaxID=7719 RepID=UPI000EF5100C|nr:zonadhesin-like isoform X2 [Ciona intestinalis]|eukprot:XP_026694758.1 zonadhesin-like isoform X2 [Ciona intestinalis]
MKQQKYQTETTEGSAETIKVLAETTEVPAETTEVPTEKTEIPAETSEGSADTTEVPTETTEIPTETTEVPTETIEIPAETTKVLAETTEVSTKISESDLYAISGSGLETVTSASTFKEVTSSTHAISEASLLLLSGSGAETTELPAEITEVLVETTKLPAETTEVPDEITEVLVETTKLPAETTEVPDETTKVLAEITEVLVASVTTVLSTLDVKLSDLVILLNQTMAQEDESTTEVPSPVSTATQTTKGLTSLAQETTGFTSTVAVSKDSSDIFGISGSGLETATPASTSKEVTSSTYATSEATRLLLSGSGAETTEAPAETTKVLAETTEVPAKTTKVPAETTEILDETTEVPAETTKVPAETTKLPAETTKVRAETTKVPAETTEVLAQTTKVPAETTEVLVASATTALPTLDVKLSDLVILLNQTMDREDESSTEVLSPVSTATQTTKTLPTLAPETTGFTSTVAVSAESSDHFGISGSGPDTLEGSSGGLVSTTLIMAPETTEVPAETTETPVETTEVRIKTTETTAETTAVTTELPAETTEAPAETTEAPTETTEVPAKTTEVPTETTEVPTETTEVPAETTEVPTETTEVPAETTEAPTETTEAPIETTFTFATTKLPDFGGICFSNPCHNGGSCVEHGLDDFYCICPHGLHGEFCDEDDDECFYGSDSCDHSCGNTFGSYECSCFSGYALSSDRRTCLDIDECQYEETHQCQHQCNNTIGSYQCSCYNGYTLLPDGITCKDIDYCQSRPCQNNAPCLSLKGRYLCICPRGYTGYQCEVDLSTPCSRGWRKFEGFCYQYQRNVRLKWRRAQWYCKKKHNATLPSIHSRRENFFVRSLSSKYLWIGLNDIRKESRFRWPDQTPVDFLRWQRNQPQSYLARNEDCVVMLRRKGVWNDVSCRYRLPFACKKAPVGCRDIPQVDNATPVTTRINFGVGEILQYTCNAGFTSSGPTDVVCTKRGVFSRPGLSCVGACMPPPVIPNAEIPNAEEAYLLGDVAKYACNPGFRGSGHSYIKCRSDLTWSPTNFRCNSECSIPPVIPNARPVTYKRKTSYKFGNVVKYSCNRGYRSSSTKNKVTCLRDGTWGTPTFVCHDGCGVVPRVANARPRPQGSKIVLYVCDSGYYPTGWAFISCRNGQWGSPKLQCL